MPARSAFALSSNPQLHIESGSVHVGMHPVMSETGPIAKLILLHDLSFIERRSQDTRVYLVVLIAGLGLCIALIALVAAQIS